MVASRLMVDHRYGVIIIEALFEAPEHAALVWATRALDFAFPRLVSPSPVAGVLLTAALHRKLVELVTDRNPGSLCFVSPSAFKGWRACIVNWYKPEARYDAQ